jgi:ketosteroid isomerase-like protein
VSQETVRLARQVLDILGPHDEARLIELSDPEVEWRSFFALSAEGVYRGYDGARQYMSDVRDAFEIGFAEVDDALGIADIAVCVGRIRYKGEGSGIEGASPAGWMLKFRDRKLLRFSAFRDPARALEAVGLAE